jgi:hypothetical protein
MLPKFFKITVDGLVIRREEVIIYKELAKILERDRGSAGDSQGRKKQQALKEFKYMYMYCHPESTPNRNGLTDKDKHKESVKLAGLPEGWTPDNDILLAMRVYEKELASTLSLNMIRNARKAAASINKTLDVLVKKLDQSIDGITPETDTDALATIIKSSNMIMDLLTEIPEKVLKLEKAEKQLFTEIATDDKKRGGDDIPETYLVEN